MVIITSYNQSTCSTSRLTGTSCGGPIILTRLKTSNRYTMAIFPLMLVTSNRLSPNSGVSLFSKHSATWTLRIQDTPSNQTSINLPFTRPRRCSLSLDINNEHTANPEPLQWSTGQFAKCYHQSTNYPGPGNKPWTSKIVVMS